MSTAIVVERPHDERGISALMLSLLLTILAIAAVVVLAS